jgi:hypothetical protein
VTAGLLITSATVRVVRAPGMPRSLRGHAGTGTGLRGRGTGRVHPTATRRSRPGAAAVTRRRDAPPVFRLTTLLQSLGNAGAVANARSVLDARVREDGQVEALVRRLDHALPEPVVPAAA